MAVDRRMVKPSEAARLLGVHENTIRNWIRAGAIPYVKTPGGHYLLPWSLLTQALRGTYDVSARLPERPPRMGERGFFPDHTAERRAEYARTTPGELVREAIEVSRTATRLAVIGRRGRAR